MLPAALPAAGAGSVWTWWSTGGAFIAIRCAPALAGLTRGLAAPAPPARLLRCAAGLGALGAGTRAAAPTAQPAACMAPALRPRMTVPAARCPTPPAAATASAAPMATPSWPASAGKWSRAPRCCRCAGRPGACWPRQPAPLLLRYGVGQRGGGWAESCAAAAMPLLKSLLLLPLQVDSTRRFLLGQWVRIWINDESTGTSRASSLLAQFWCSRGIAAAVHDALLFCLTGSDPPRLTSAPCRRRRRRRRRGRQHAIGAPPPAGGR